LADRGRDRHSGSADPEPDPDQYPFQPDLKPSDTFSKKFQYTVLSKIFQYTVLSKILKTMTPVALMRKNVNWHCGNKSKKRKPDCPFLNLG
jgi:hypothetical protein